jgi:Enoyl-CoA hydratase/isomerase
MPAYRTLLFTVDRGVATITLNRPQQRNAIGDGMREELADAYRACDRDHSLRAIVLTGTPPRSAQVRIWPAVSGRSPNPGRASAPRASTCPHGHSPSR